MKTVNGVAPFIRVNMKKSFQSNVEVSMIFLINMNLILKYDFNFAAKRFAGNFMKFSSDTMLKGLLFV